MEARERRSCEQLEELLLARMPDVAEDIDSAMVQLRQRSGSWAAALAAVRKRRAGVNVDIGIARVRAVAWWLP